MEKPNIIGLPTSQMMALCDVLGLPPEVQDSTESMIIGLEKASFTKLKVVKQDPDKARPENSIGFEPDQVDADIVAARKVALGRD